MFRLFDWECQVCGDKEEHLACVPSGESPPRTIDATCDACGKVTRKDRLFPLPAKYMGEAACNAVVRGGKYDTAGMRKLEKLPPLPGEAEHQRRCSEAAAKCETASEARQAVLAMAKEGPTAADYAAHFAKPEYREAERRRRRTQRENKQKQKRLAALRRGEPVNMRRDKCAGDPNWKA
jgi:hypothetical protein